MSPKHERYHYATRRKYNRFTFWLLDMKRILIAELNLKLVPHERIELPSPDYKTGVLPFN